MRFVPSARPLLSLATSVTLVGAISACSGEDIAERVIENRLEAEGAGDVDLDLDGGNVRIETDEGVVEMQIDDEGNMTIQNEEGSMEMSVEDGNISMESDEGSFEMNQGSELPADFPAAVPLPDGLVLQVSQAVETPEGSSYILSGTVTGNAEEVADRHISAIEAAGFAQIQVIRSTGSVIYNYSNGELVIGGFVADDPSSPGNSQTTLQVGPDPG
ncbi:MAG: hypothetical protein ACO225_10445 [Ilumatobacteraceae bacterium]